MNELSMVSVWLGRVEAFLKGLSLAAVLPLWGGIKHKAASYFLQWNHAFVEAISFACRF